MSRAERLLEQFDQLVRTHQLADEPSSWMLAVTHELLFDPSGYEARFGVPGDFALDQVVRVFERARTHWRRVPANEPPVAGERVLSSTPVTKDEVLQRIYVTKAAAPKWRRTGFRYNPQRHRPMLQLHLERPVPDLFADSLARLLWPLSELLIRVPPQSRIPPEPVKDGAQVTDQGDWAGDALKAKFLELELLIHVTHFQRGGAIEQLLASILPSLRHNEGAGALFEKLRAREYPVQRHIPSARHRAEAAKKVVGYLEVLANKEKHRLLRNVPASTLSRWRSRGVEVTDHDAKAVERVRAMMRARQLGDESAVSVKQFAARVGRSRSTVSKYLPEAEAASGVKAQRVGGAIRLPRRLATELRRILASKRGR